MSASTFQLSRFSALVPASLLLLCALLLLIPKLFLLNFAHELLWCDYSIFDVVMIFAQDLSMAGFVLWASVLFLRRPTVVRYVGLMGVSSLLLAILLIDSRVRELWLEPISLNLIFYSFKNWSDLTSGGEIFFNHPYGFSLTFRRALALIGVTWITLWSILFYLMRRSALTNPNFPSSRWAWSMIGFALFFLVISSFAPFYRYKVEENIFMRPVAGLLRPSLQPTEESTALAARFDQASRPLQEVLGAPPRTFPSEGPSFTNLVIIMLESIRWKGMGFDGAGENLMPYLTRLGREGTLTRCYVSLPHSSKTDYAVITGRHPYPGIEIRESLQVPYPSVFRALKEHRNAKTYCFSSVYLAFENLDGLLASCGIDHRMLTSDLAKRAGRVARSESSFGMLDELLYELTPPFLAEQPGPFAALLLPLAAHYPYDYPGKDATAGDGFESFKKSVEHADRQLEKLMENFRSCGLFSETLFVLVGDHGESFGEHGSLIHNNSLYEEEITVPLIFWSESGLLRDLSFSHARHIDIVPTVADLFGLTDLSMPVQGLSLLRETAHPTVYVSTFFDNVALAIIEYPRKHMFFPDQGDLLEFDLESDPDERHGRLVKDESARKPIIRRLQAFNAYQRQWNAHLPVPLTSN